MMAAVRRALFLRNKFTASLNSLNVYINNRFSFKERSLLKRFGTGLCITLGGFAVYYQYNSTSQRENKAGRLRARISPLPAVLAKEEVTESTEDQEVHMSAHKHRFRLFSSLEFDGQLYMTPLDFIESITMSEPKKPHAGFKIAFNMFDADGNKMVDKREFMVLEEIFRKKNEKRKERGGDPENSSQLHEPENATETTLLVHFFGRKGKRELNFDDFYRFMDNLQTEVLEIEFLSYSKGMTTISEEDFARILLRYTVVENITGYLENVRHSIPDEKGISFEEFRSFFQFLNNLEDFTIAMQMYNYANRPIGQDEFGRAVYVATGLKLSRHLVNTVFKIFDVDHDDHLSYKEFIGIMKDRLHRGSLEKSSVFLSHFHITVKKSQAGLKLSVT
ncbi:Calcium uptake protein 3, mitochondrial EF-hand domain-containing family member A2 [Triplophysa tibetana]|uniref:Calcium uptake protein 3, mitochondrial EF-hand domain-containing family member A2 n=1 Tax=Triplophysa tibetana TaxID=1572043 RepID=A0A5A9NK28_9TELE|nr:Calcium uptake protein 3, mitochondrial EF-hand domain-containing family member A2 [Triplophysa tibetana]